LPEDIEFAVLVDIAKLRWRIERDYQELKQEVGLDHFEGRGWRGFHHHATMCIASYGFLISERETIPPSGPRPAKVVRRTCRSRRSPTPRRRRRAPSATFQIRSQPCAAASPSRSRYACRDARAAKEQRNRDPSNKICDTVKLSGDLELVYRRLAACHYGPGDAALTPAYEAAEMTSLWHKPCSPNFEAGPSASGSTVRRSNR
jgi:Transposase DDE domain